MALVTVFFAAFRAGYRLDAQRRIMINSSSVGTEMRVYWEITGSGIRNSKVMNKPEAIPVAPLTRIISKA